MRRVNRRLLREQQGASSVIVALCMTAILIVVALVVDIGATAARKAQLQDAADAAALAIAQRCYEDWDAAVGQTTNDLYGCPTTVLESARGEAALIAADHFGNDLEGLELLYPPAPSMHAVTVSVGTAQSALFSFVTNADAANVEATATAEWQLPAVPLPLAVSECMLPAPNMTVPAFVGTGLYSGTRNLVEQLLGLPALSSLVDLPDYLGDVLDCGTSVLAGGWLGSTRSDCTYDPNLMTTLTSTLNRLLPVDPACTELIRSLVGKRIIVPVYDQATTQLLGQALNPLLGGAEIDRYAEIIVTGYEFNGVLGIGSLQNYSPSMLEPSCANSLADLLGIDPARINEIFGSVLGAVINLAGGLVNWLINVLGQVIVDDLLDLVDLCQGVQGYVVQTDLTEEEAKAALTPYRLVA